MLLTEAELFIKTYKRNLIPVISFPKSGSQTFFKRLKVLFHKGSIYIEPKIFAGSGHSFPIVQKVPFSLSLNHFYYGHALASGYLFNFFKYYKKFNKVLFLIRPLKDCIISYHSHIIKHGFGPLDLRIKNNPTYSANWESLDISEQIDKILNFILPEYIKLIESWHLASSSYSFAIRHVCFEEIASNSTNLFQEIHESFPFLVSEDLSKPIDHVKKNISNNPPSRYEFSSSQKQKIKDCVNISTLDASLKDYLLK